IAVVQDDRAARVAKRSERRMRDRATVDAARLAGERSNHVEVVNGVIQHLEPRRVLQKRPLLPRLSVDHADFDVRQLAEPPLLDQLTERDHVRAEAQLKIDGGGQAAIVTRGEDAPRAVEVLAHRFLNQQRRAFRQPLDDALDLIARHGEIEHDIAARGRFVEAMKDNREVERARGFLRGVDPDVVDAGDRQIEPAIGGQMRRAYDRAGADDDDGTRMRRCGPRLPETGHFCTGGGAPPPPRAIALTSPRISTSSARRATPARLPRSGPTRGCRALGPRWGPRCSRWRLPRARRPGLAGGSPRSHGPRLATVRRAGRR